MIFLYMSITGLTIQHMGEHFQWSNKTISKYFCLMLNISSNLFYTTYLNLPNANTPPSQCLSCNPKMWPFFQFTLGALDGSHIVCTPPLYSHAPYQNRKGFISQNCLFTCNFNFQFMFTYTGWEGSATDAQVMDTALKVGLDIPEGYYYLGDVVMSLPIRYSPMASYF